MAEHYTKATVEATVWCDVCHRETPHRIDGGRRGPCKVCLMAPPERKAKAKPAPPVQLEFKMECARCGGTGQVWYSSTRSGPCPDCSEMFRGYRKDTG